MQGTESHDLYLSLTFYFILRNGYLFFETLFSSLHKINSRT